MAKRCIWKYIIVFAFVFGLIGQASIASADTPAAPAPAAPAVDPDDLKFFKDIEVHGFASASYLANFDDPITRRNNFRAFDFSANSFKFDVGVLTLQKDAAKPGDIGFRTDIAYGFSVPQVSKSSPGIINPGIGLPSTRAATNDDFDVIQGFVSYNAPVGNGLKFDLGKFVTNIGVELIPGPSGWNQNFSHSWLFTYGPYTHTGLRVGYSIIPDKLSVMGMVANGWDNSVDTNNGKLWHGQIAYNPLSNVSLIYNWMGGPETQLINVNNEYGWRHLHDFIATVGLTDTLKLTLNADFGHDENNPAIVTGQDAHWWMFVGYLRHDCNKWFSMNLRGERFDDRDGARTGFRQQLWEVTMTPEFRVHKHLVVRPEYRHDQSDINSFAASTSGRLVNSQDTFAVNALFFF